MGTIALGSLVISSGRVIRMTFGVLDHNAREEDNVCNRCILRCSKCFCQFFERILLYLTKNVYIMCAIHGKPFASSAEDAFNLLMRNIFESVEVTNITGFIFLMTSMLLTICVSVTAYFYISGGETGQSLNYMAVPITIIAIGTFLIVRLCLSVYSAAIDTLFLCLRKFEYKESCSSKSAEISPKDTSRGNFADWNFFYNIFYYFVDFCSYVLEQWKMASLTIAQNISHITWPTI